MASARLARRRELLETVMPQLLKCPFEHLSLQNVADQCGLSLWALRYSFDNIQGLFNALAYHLLERAAAALRYEAPLLPSVVGAIEHYAAFLARTVDGEAYQEMLRFLLRNGAHHEWLVTEYDRRIVALVTAQLDAAILASGKRFGATVLLRSDAAHRFHKRIESEFALMHVLPPHCAPGGERADKALRDIVAEAYAATYRLDLDEASAA